MHSAVIATIGKFTPITGADRIVAAQVNNGTVDIATVVVGKEHTDGEIGIYFCPDLQLSTEYCEANNLLAKFDETGKKIAGSGYFDHRRKVTAQKFKGVKSEGIWLPLTSLAFTGIALDTFTVGAQLTGVNNVPLCAKYYSPQTASARASNQPKIKTLDDRVNVFPKHVDTEQLAYGISNIPAGALIIITEKEHGTSHRVGNVPVAVTLPWWKRAINRVSQMVRKHGVYPTQTYQIVHGSRNRVVSVSDDGFHGSESFRMDTVGTPALDENIVIYGEITGYANGKPIMAPQSTKDIKSVAKRYGDTMVYDYGNEEGKASFRVYNVRYVYPTGKYLDFAWNDVVALSKIYGYQTVHELDSFTYDGNAERLMTWVKSLAEFFVDGYSHSMWSNKHISEGVVIRAEYIDPVTNDLRVDVYKYKSFAFKLFEGIVKLDDTSVDMEETA